MYNMTFDFKKPTVQMLGRWQPWHDGHTALFKKALTLTGQVVIMVREVYGFDGDAGAGGEVQTVTGPTGSYVMQLAAGTYRVAVQVDGYLAPMATDVEIASDRVTTLDVRLEPVLRLYLPLEMRAPQVSE